ncbi:MAG: tetratricopeptide repeat protein [Candidatus Electrothrix sp. AUS4]|nr:tetratricopeptide repeat protein [Candidatus Electrothrix sp. AUS4]
MAGWSRYMDREQSQINELATYQKTEEMQRKALVPDEALDSKKGMAAQYTHLGNTYTKHGELDKAEEMYRKGLAVYEALGSKEGMAANYGNLGFLYEKRGNLDNAEEMHRKSLRLFQEMGDTNAQRAQQALDQLAQERNTSTQ